MYKVGIKHYYMALKIVKIAMTLCLYIFAYEVCVNAYYLIFSIFLAW